MSWAYGRVKKETLEKLATELGFGIACIHRDGVYLETPKGIRRYARYQQAAMYMYKVRSRRAKKAKEEVGA